MFLLNLNIGSWEEIFTGLWSREKEAKNGVLWDCGYWKYEREQVVIEAILGGEKKSQRYEGIYEKPRANWPILGIRFDIMENDRVAFIAVRASKLVLLCWQFAMFVAIPSDASSMRIIHGPVGIWCSQPV